MAREHYNLVNALRNLQELAFSSVVRNAITRLAFQVDPRDNSTGGDYRLNLRIVSSPVYVP